MHLTRSCLYSRWVHTYIRQFLKADKSIYNETGFDYNVHIYNVHMYSHECPGEIDIHMCTTYLTYAHAVFLLVTWIMILCSSYSSILNQTRHYKFYFTSIHVSQYNHSTYFSICNYFKNLFLTKEFQVQ